MLGRSCVKRKPSYIGNALIKKIIYLCFTVLALLITIMVLGNTDDLASSLVPADDLAICGAWQPNTSDKTCIVDGDTLWLNGHNTRLLSSRSDVHAPFF